MSVVYQSTNNSRYFGDANTQGFQRGLTAIVSSAVAALDQVSDFDFICARYEIDTGSTACVFTLGTIGTDVQNGYNMYIFNRSEQPLTINDSSSTLVLLLESGNTCNLLATASGWSVFWQLERPFRQLLVKRKANGINTQSIPTVPIPGGLLGPNDSIVGRAYILRTSGTTATQYQVNLIQAGTNTLAAMGASSGNNPCQITFLITNNGSLSNQQGQIFHSNSGGTGMGAGTLTGVVNTANSFSVELRSSPLISINLLSFELYLIREKQNIYDI